MTYTQLQCTGELIDKTAEGTVQLWRLDGVDYVVLANKTVMTKEEAINLKRTLLSLYNFQGNDL